MNQLNLNQLLCKKHRNKIQNFWKASFMGLALARVYIIMRGESQSLDIIHTEHTVCERCIVLNYNVFAMTEKYTIFLTHVFMLLTCQNRVC